MIRAMVQGLRFAPWALAVAATGAAAQQAGVPAASEPVAIYYDGPPEALVEGFLDSHQIQNLLGHFGLSTEILPIGEYKSGQLARYRAAFFAGTASGTRLPGSFLADVRSYDRPFC